MHNLTSFLIFILQWVLDMDFLSDVLESSEFLGRIYNSTYLGFIAERRPMAITFSRLNNPVSFTTI
jgi:hypothetical protein